MESLVDRAISFAPDLSAEEAEEPDERLIRAIEEVKPLIVEFCSVVECIAAMNAATAALSLYKGFGKLLECYTTPIGFSGSYRESDFDFFKFIGHELFVDFFSLLIREDRWEIVGDLLGEDLRVRNARINRGELVSFDYASEYVHLLDVRNRRLERNRVSLHADILKSRYEEGELSRYVSIEDFMEADYFLYLRGIVEETDASKWIRWRPWSALYMSRKPPKYLAEAVRRKNAEKMLRPLGVSSVDSLKQILMERSGLLGRFYSARAPFYDHPLSEFNLSAIASR